MSELLLSFTAMLTACTFFGLFYPEYVLLPETYEYIENGVAKEKDSTRDFYRILDAKKGEVTVHSEILETLMEKFHKKDQDMEGKQTCRIRDNKQNSTNGKTKTDQQVIP